MKELKNDKIDRMSNFGQREPARRARNRIASSNEVKITLQDILVLGERDFRKAKLYFGHGTDNAWDDAVAIVRYVLQLPPDIDAIVLERKLTVEECEQIRALFEQRIETRIPVPYLTHEAYFMGLPFYVDERVLIPRSPFAELIEKQFAPWANGLQVKNILDIGTGSGCMAIACALAFPKAQVDAVDISQDALEVAKINVAKYQLNDRVHLIQSDVFSTIPTSTYDVIISNPPYVGEEEMASLPKEYAHEPVLALAAGVNGLDVVEKILAEAKAHLTKNGLLFIEVGNSEEALVERFPNMPFLWLEFEQGGGGVLLLARVHIPFNLIPNLLQCFDK